MTRIALRLCWKFAAVYLVSRRSHGRGNPITSNLLTGMSGKAWGGLRWLQAGLSLIPPKGEIVPIASAENDPARVEKTYQRPHCSFVCTQEQTTANCNSAAKRLDHLATVDLSAVRLSTGYLNEICFLNMICILSGTCLNPSKWIKWNC